MLAGRRRGSLRRSNKRSNIIGWAYVAEALCRPIRAEEQRIRPDLTSDRLKYVLSERDLLPI